MRVPISIISILTPIGIYGFAFGCGIDFLIRGIYYKHKSLEVIKKSNKAIEGEKK